MILVVCGLVSIASAFTQNYELLFVERVFVAIAGVSFVVGIQHVAQWFNANEIGTAEGLYAGTGNVGAGMGALVLPRLFGTDYHSAFLWLGIIALFIAAWYLIRGRAAKTVEQGAIARQRSDLRSTAFVWSRYIAVALMLAYAMSFGLEVAMNAWLPGYFTRGYHAAILALGFTNIAGLQIAAGTFAAVESVCASLFRPFAGFMSDLFQRKGWTPLPFIAKSLPYAPRLHWLGIALILITLAMGGLTFAGLTGSLHASVLTLVALGVFISFGTGGTFALVPLLFPDRPGTAAGFIGGVSTAAGIVLSAHLRSEHEHPHGLPLCRPLHVRADHPLLLLGGALRASPRRARHFHERARRRRRVSLIRSFSHELRGSHARANLLRHARAI